MFFSVFLPQLLLYPNPADPLNGEAATLMFQDKNAYHKRVQEYVKKYASVDFRLKEEETDEAPRGTRKESTASSSSASSSRSASADADEMEADDADIDQLSDVDDDPDMENIEEDADVEPVSGSEKSCKFSSQRQTVPH